AINDMLEEYERDTNPAITITSDQFKAMPEWDQREVLNELLLGANNAQNEEARKAIQNKYRDLLTTQLETKGQMIIEENIETQLSKNQLQIRTKPLPPRLELPKTGYREEYQYPGSPRSPPKLPTESDKSIDSDASERKRWMPSITKRLRPLSPTGGWKQMFGGSGSSKQNIQQHTHSPKRPSSLRNSVDLTNTPDILLPTPIQNNQQTRNPKRPIDRSNTSSPASWHKNQKMYTPSVTNFENEEDEQEISQNIERAFNQDNQENNSESQQIQIQSSFKG
ncbi:620_t:CDS:1, partial [Dentiscutata heterogama]